MGLVLEVVSFIQNTFQQQLLISIFLVTATLCLSFAVSLLRRAESANVPIVGVDSKLWFPMLRARLKYVTGGFGMVQTAYEKVCEYLVQIRDDF